ncbi:MAG: AAA family ATPase, partial [Thermoplasmata archaeon]|nr:AAA family ATPase [Thermoplasmata archaeon]
MKIDGIQIDGFGIFYNKKITSLNPKLNLFLGPNEAGKSTILEFIRRILYGYPDGRSKQNQYMPLKGGNHGGTLTIKDENGDKYRVERYVGSQVKLLDSAGNAFGEYDLNKILGHSQNEVYRNVYAFSLSELQTFDTLSNDDVKNRLYSAGAGMGSISLSDVQKELNKQSEELFKERGSKQIINTLFSECGVLDESLRDIQKNQGEFDKY